jgi:CheY-like chemotaxis protein
MNFATSLTDGILVKLCLTGFCWLVSPQKMTLGIGYDNHYIILTDNGEDAVLKAVSQHIDLVLMDIRLPGIDGYETTKRILQQKPDLTIIAQTAYASNNDRQKAIMAGCTDYISKPIQKSLLLILVTKYLTQTSML